MESIFLLKIHGYSIIFMIWNILLAVTPCWIAYYVALGVKNRKWKKLKTERGALVLLFLLWLFFFPNTAYLFLTVRHLVNYCTVFDLYRVCQSSSWIPMVFFVYALVGLPTFYYALNKMKEVFERVFNEDVANTLPVVVIPFTAIGMMLGLYGRFNTWDILRNPVALLEELFGYFQDPSRFADFAIFTLSLYLVYYMTKRLLKDD